MYYLVTLRSKAPAYVAVGWKLPEQVGTFIPSCNENQVILEFDGPTPPPQPETER